MKKITLDTFISSLKNIKKTNISFLPEEYKDSYFRINHVWTRINDMPDKEKKLQDFLYFKSLSLKKGESQFYISLQNEIIAISSDFIVYTNCLNGFTVLNNKSFHLYSFNVNYKLSKFYITSNKFKFLIDEEKNINNIILLFNVEDSKNYIKDIEFSLKNENTLSIISNMGLTSIKFNDSDIFATFKGSAYSNIILDYDFNIKSVEINKKLKKTLEIDNKITYFNVKNYSDLMSQIKDSIKDNLDYISLTKDLTIKIKDSEKKFNKDLEFIKKITINKEKIFEIFNSNQIELLNFFNEYKNYSLLFETNSYDTMLSFFDMNENNGNNFMNFDMLNTYQKINEHIKYVLSFNEEILSFKNKK